MDLTIEMTIRVTNNVTGKHYELRAAEPVDAALSRSESAQRLLDSLVFSKISGEKRAKLLEVENG